MEEPGKARDVHPVLSLSRRNSRSCHALNISINLDMSRVVADSLSPEFPDLPEMAVVVGGQDLGELFDRQLPALRVEPGATPGRVRQRSEEEQRVLPQPPELLGDGLGIRLRVLQLR